MQQELRRKAFHLLILVYLFYYLEGGSLVLFSVWAALITAIEIARLRVSFINEWILKIFGSLMRKEEKYKFSGMVGAALGCALTFWIFGSDPKIITGALLVLVFGDAAAALVGRAFGRHVFSIGGAKKSLQGSAACFVICLLIFAALGFPGLRVFSAAAACTLLETLPLPISDNLWLPLGAAFALKILP